LLTSRLSFEAAFFVLGFAQWRHDRLTNIVQKNSGSKKGAQPQGCGFQLSLAKNYAHAMIGKFDQYCQKQALSQSQKTNSNIAACAMTGIYCNLKN
jgi:hypothetical protein